jgi:hypothetical protein
MDEGTLKITNRSNQVIRDFRAVKVMPAPHSLSVANPNIVQRHNMNSRTRRDAPLAPIAHVTDFGNLVTRALAILAEETEAWQARRASGLPRGGPP